MEENLHIFANGRQPRYFGKWKMIWMFWNWKTNSIYFQFEDNLNFLLGKASLASPGFILSLWILKSLKMISVIVCFLKSLKISKINPYNFSGCNLKVTPHIHIVYISLYIIQYICSSKTFFLVYLSQGNNKRKIKTLHECIHTVISTILM